jgi:putative copper export protein
LFDHAETRNCTVPRSRLLTSRRRQALAASLAAGGLVLWVLAVMLGVAPAATRDVTQPHIEAQLLAIIVGGALITSGIIVIASG